MGLRHLALAACCAIALAACGGGEEGGGDGSGSARLVAPAAFAEAMAEPDRATINVHVPDEGSIAGTELAIPFDAVEAHRSELPPAGTPLALYCRSGRMSAIASVTLAELGYTDIVDLEGGMLAWQEDGRELLPAGTPVG